jgi:succinate-acetate transporter protein
MAQVDPAVSPPAPSGAGFADPAPLGLAAFALTTFVLMVYRTGMIGTGDDVVLGLALAYGGFGQLIAGLWEFAKGNTFGATAFCSYGGFWISYWWLADHIPAGTKGNDLNHGIGVYLLVWGIFTLYMFIASTKISGALMAVFAALALTFFALAIGNLDAGSTDWTKLGGWLGIATALFAWYASFAGVMAATYKRAVLPTFPR